MATSSPSHTNAQPTPYEKEEHRFVQGRAIAFEGRELRGLVRRRGPVRECLSNSDWQFVALRPGTPAVRVEVRHRDQKRRRLGALGLARESWAPTPAPGAWFLRVPCKNDEKP